MKKIEAIIKPFTFDSVKEELQKVGITGHDRIRGERVRPSEGPTELYRGSEYVIDFLPKVEAGNRRARRPARRRREAITRKAARNGKIGDGKIFVTGLDDVSASAPTSTATAPSDFYGERSQRS